MNSDSLTAQAQQALIRRTLRESMPFRVWPEHCIEALVALGRVEHYARGAQVLAHDRNRREVFIVASGCIEISLASANGKKFVHKLVGPGIAVALVRLLDPAPMIYDYHAHDDTLLVHLPGDGVLGVLDGEPILWRSVAQLMLERYGDTLGVLHDQALGSLGQRLAALLLDLARLHGVQEPDGLVLRLRLPQDELGAMLGVSRQSANKELRLLEDGGVIGADYNRITIRDLPTLRALAARQL